MTELQTFVTESLRYAISAHNSQPFVLKWPKSGELELWVQGERLLPIADPKLKDLIMSAGAVFETLRLALTERATKLEIITLDEVTHPSFSGSFRIGSFCLTKDAALKKDPLASQLPRRFSFRGGFKPMAEGEKTASAEALRSFSEASSNPKFAIRNDSSSKKAIAQLYDEVNVRFLGLPGYVGELKSWMRLSRTHQAWASDGLNSESLALSGIEALGANVVLKPSVFSFLNRIGLAKFLVTEAPKVASAEYVVAFYGKDEGHFEAGRSFLRAWLALTSMELFGAPLSLLTDDPQALGRVREIFGLANDVRIYNVLRIGRLPKNYVRYQPARRPSSELNLSGATP